MATHEIMVILHGATWCAVSTAHVREVRGTAPEHGLWSPWPESAQAEASGDSHRYYFVGLGTVGSPRWMFAAECEVEPLPRARAWALTPVCSRALNAPAEVLGVAMTSRGFAWLIR